jgi:thioredoxin-dependent peroxiredoxin
MSLRINSEAPNFTAETTEGKIDFHQWIGNGWAILFSHPKDFTPVCTTELGYMAGLKPEFDKCNCKIIGLALIPSITIRTGSRISLTYPMTSGRNFDEVLRLLDSLQLTAQQPVATPVKWNPAGDVIIVPSVSDEQARKKFPGGWKAPKPYLRIVPPVFF